MLIDCSGPEAPIRDWRKLSFAHDVALLVRCHPCSIHRDVGEVKCQSRPAVRQEKGQGRVWATAVIRQSNSKDSRQSGAVKRSRRQCIATKPMTAALKPCGFARGVPWDEFLTTSRVLRRKQA